MFDLLVEFFYNLQADLNTDYVYRSCFVSAFFGLLFFSIFLFLAIKNKDGRLMGFVAAFLQIVGCMSTTWLIVSFNKAELYNVFYELTLDEPDLEKFFIDLMGLGVLKMAFRTVPSAIASVLCTLGWLSAFLYIIRIRSGCSRRLSGVSIVLHILRLILVSPIPFFFAFRSGGNTQALQQQYDLVFYVVSLLPFLLILISNIFGNKDDPEDEFENFHYGNFGQETDVDNDNVVVTVEGEEINK